MIVVHTPNSDESSTRSSTSVLPFTLEGLPARQCQGFVPRRGGRFSRRRAPRHHCPISAHRGPMLRRPRLLRRRRHGPTLWFSCDALWWTSTSLHSNKKPYALQSCISGKYYLLCGSVSRRSTRSGACGAVGFRVRLPIGVPHLAQVGEFLKVVQTRHPDVVQWRHG